MRILVTAASRHGATAELAAAIAKRLATYGFDVTLAEPRAVATLDGYDAVVLGSAVYAGRWMKPAREFAERLSAELSARPVWLFSSGPVGDPPQPSGQSVDVKQVSELTGAHSHRVLAGHLDRDVLGLVERLIVRAVGAVDGDFRDWAEVAAWTDEIARALDPANAPSA